MYKTYINIDKQLQTLYPFNAKRRAVIPLTIKITSKDMREKPTNTPITHSVY
jgi:hypothetical protein